MYSCGIQRLALLRAFRQAALVSLGWTKLQSSTRSIVGREDTDYVQQSSYRISVAKTFEEDLALALSQYLAPITVLWGATQYQ